DDIKELPLSGQPEAGQDMSDSGPAPEELDEMSPEAQAPQANIVTIADVADVERVTEEQTSITRMNGEEALSISITATQDAALIYGTHARIDAIVELTEAVSRLDLTVVFDQAPFIDASIPDLATARALPLLFAVVAILVFLLSVRNISFTAITIPLSLL